MSVGPANRRFHPDRRLSPFFPTQVPRVSLLVPMETSTSIVSGFGHAVSNGARGSGARMW